MSLMKPSLTFMIPPKSGSTSLTAVTSTALGPRTFSSSSREPHTRVLSSLQSHSRISTLSLRTLEVRTSKAVRSVKNGMVTGVVTTESSPFYSLSLLMATPGTDLSNPSMSRVLEMPTLSSSTLLWITSGMDSTQDNSVCLASLLLSKVVMTTPSNTLELLLVKCVTSSMEIEEVS